MARTTWDVVIVGAGPTGLTLACELSRQGITDILIIDRLGEPLKQTKASVLWPRSLELLANYDGVVEDVHAYCEYVRQMKFNTREGTLAHVQIGSHFDSKYSHGALLEQWYTEKVLTAYLTKKNIHVQRQVEMISYEYTTDQEIAVTVKTNEDVKTFKAKYLIGCDGGRSLVRKGMNCAFEGEVLPIAFAAVHFTTTEPLKMKTDEMHMNLFDNGASFVTAMPGKNNYLAAIDLSQAQDAIYCDTNRVDSHGLPIQLPFTQEQLNELVSDRIFPCKFDKIVWQTHFRVNERLAATYSDNKRVFLAGDACHCHTPLGGQGMNTGIQDAVNLGWKLAFVLNGVAKPDLLSTYGTERRLVGQELIAFTTRSQNISSSRSALTQFLRNRAFRILTSFDFVVDTIAATIGETIIAYKGSQLSAEHWKKPSIFPYLLYRRRQNILRMFKSRVVAGGRAPALETLSPDFFSSTTGFKVLFFEGLPGFSLQPLPREKLNAFGKSLVQESNGIITAFEVITSDQVKSHQKYGVEAQCLFLIRPDGYVGLRSEPVDAEDVLRYLKHRLGALKTNQAVDAFHPEAFDWIPFALVAAIAGTVLSRFLSKS